MAMARSFTLFHALLVAFACLGCAKVGATFDDVTGVVAAANKEYFSLRGFGSVKNGGQIPAAAPWAAPSVELKTPTSSNINTFGAMNGDVDLAALKYDTPKSTDTEFASLEYDVPKNTRSASLEYNIRERTGVRSYEYSASTVPAAHVIKT